MRTPMRWLAAGLALALALPLGTVLWLRTSLPDYDGTATIAGLSAPVSVIRDARAVPHIYARSLDDAMLALGYAHAQDRLFMLEFYRRQSQGRLAEILGPAALESDRFVRMASVHVSDERILGALDAAERARLAAYAAGINAYLAARRGALPPEFVYLGIAPAPWSVADAARLGTLTAFDRDGWRAALTRLELASKLPPSIVDAVLDDYADVEPALLRRAADAHRATQVTGRHADARPALRLPRRSVASNAWAVTPARSATGGALFAADPHIDLVLPSIYSPAHLVTPELEFSGFVIPGEAALVGHSRSMAWGMTHAAAYSTALVVERVDDATQRYLSPDGWRPLAIEVQTVAVRGGPPERLVIRSTARGPIVSDHLAAARDVARALGPDRALVIEGLDPSGGSADAGFIASTHALALSRSIEDLEVATARYRGVDNLTVADRDGGIAIRTLLPPEHFRWPDGGSTSSGDAPRPVRSSSDMPGVSNPPCGVVANANERLSTGPAHCAVADTAGFRARRLRERLAATPRHTLESFRAIQLDTVSAGALALLPALRSILPRDALETAAIERLRRWDGSTGVDSIAATIFHQWLRELDALIVGDAGRLLGVSLPHASLSTYARMMSAGSSWCDDLRTAAPARTCREVAQLAFQRSVRTLRDRAGADVAHWQWGRFHQAVFEHPVFSHVPGLRWFGERRIAIPGGSETINAAASSWNDTDGFPVTHAALTRRLEDLQHPERSLLAFATGVSGNPLSRYYDDQLGPWARGEYFSIEGPRERFEREAIGVTTLTPAVGAPATTVGH
jgi:penicillin amidase